LIRLQTRNAPALLSRLRPLAALAIALTAAGCSSDSGSDWSSVFSMVKGYWRGAETVSLQQASAIPFASIGVRIGDGSQVIFVLASDSSGERLWVAGQRAALTTRDGRITRSAGLGHDLTGFVPTPGLFGGGPQEWSDRHIEWSVDYADIHSYSLQIQCTQRRTGIEAVVLLGKSIRTLRVDEICQAPSTGWQFTNSFWVDPDSGFVWRSIQYIRPDLDPLEIETLRPAEE
jgi:hypothetical protein